MCGIFFSAQIFANTEASQTSDSIHALPENARQRLRAANALRGPDAQNTVTTLTKCPGISGIPDAHMELEFYASELRLRGDAPVIQPHHVDGDVLCWNGEIFEGLDVAAHENDGLQLFQSIRSVHNLERLANLFGSIEGPYAFVYFNKASQCLFFGRDPLGRRSLLIHTPTPTQQYFILASVSAGLDSSYSMQELSTENVYCLDFRALRAAKDIATGFPIALSSIQCQYLKFRDCTQTPITGLFKVAEDFPPSDFSPVKSLDQIPNHLIEPVDELISRLEKSVMLRVQHIPQGFLSKGKARVAVLFSGGIDSTVITCLTHRHVPIEDPIDLLNVAFENPRKIQVQVEGNAEGLPKREKKKRARETTAKPDSSDTSASSGSYTSYLVPDRVTGLQEVEELRRLCPGRVWNFVEINVPYEESKAARAAVETAMFPRRTNMDLSLAMALHFASRGIGRIREHAEAPYENYTSSARVLLNGLGSDELLGGYGRHRTAFQQSGWQAVIDELQLEIDRIPTRNLGRDDRVTSSHGKESRHPFLSLSVVSFLAQLPVHYKMDPRLPLGLGDKTLLRLAARKLGLLEASGRKKRAMQFGSHSARMESGESERRGDLLL